MPRAGLLYWFLLIGLWFPTRRGGTLVQGQGSGDNTREQRALFRKFGRNAQSRFSRGVLQQVVIPLSADEALLNAAKQGDRGGVQNALRQGADLEARTDMGLTALIEASLRGYLPIVVDLLNLGADTEAETGLGFTALLVAAQQGHREVVEALIEAGADIEAANNDEVTPLLKAAENGYGIVLLQLLTAGASAEAQDLEGETALFKVSAYPNTTFLMESLIDRGADPNHRNVDENTPLHYAAFFGNQPNSVVLIEKGANIDAVNENGERPVDEVCRCLANMEVQDFLMCPPGFCETDEVQRSLQELLGGSFSSDINADEALFNATLAGDLEGVNLALNSGANTEARNADGYTPLILAAFLGRRNIVKQLLQAGADIEARDMLGFTALKAAAQEGKLLAVQALIAEGADVNVHSNDRATPLIKAAEGGHLRVVKALVKAGADVDACCTLDKGTALTVAVEVGNFKIAMELINSGANVSATTMDGMTALFKANVHLKTVDTVKALLVAGAEVNHRDAVGDTALAYAAFFGNKGNVKFLLKNGADPTIVNDMGEVAQDMVCRCLVNRDFEGFIQCPIGACDSEKKSAKIKKILEEALANFKKPARTKMTKG